MTHLNLPPPPIDDLAGHSPIVLEPTGPIKPEPFLVSVEETCRLLNCGRTTVFALLSSGALDRRKVGRATRVTMVSIRRLAGL